MVSASAAARKRRAICGSPSLSACRAKARYLRLAWLSPANATARFSWVVGMHRPVASGEAWPMIEVRRAPNEPRRGARRERGAKGCEDRRGSGAQEAVAEGLPLRIGEERVRGADELAA